MPTPRVSVIIPAYNAMPEITRCIDSALTQTIGAEHLEIIAVNDGSTDGTADEINRLAELHSMVTAVHQENSGGPGSPRNNGLERARGEFVFFLDADDYLAPDALRRMTEMADANGSDVVLGKGAGVNGRRSPASMFKTNQPKTDVFSSRAYWTLAPWKLYRRELVERLNLRFADFPTGEDQPFTAMAYIHAACISIISDYDCCYLTYRDNGGNVTLAPRGLDDRIGYMSAMFDLVAENVPAGPRRDVLMQRHFQVECSSAIRSLARESEDDARQRFFPEIKRWVDNYCTENLFEKFSSQDRIRLHLVRTNNFDDLLTEIRDAAKNAKLGHLREKGRVYQRNPLFRSAAAPVPDHCFDVTKQLPVRHHLEEMHWEDNILHLQGNAYIKHIDTIDARSQLILRDRHNNAEIILPLTAQEAPDVAKKNKDTDYEYNNSGFTVGIDLSGGPGKEAVPRGIWDLFLKVEAQGVSRTVRLGARRSSEIDSSKRRHIVRTNDESHCVVTPYFTKPHSNLTLDIGEVYNRLTSSCTLSLSKHHISSAPVYTVTGHIEAIIPDGSLTVRAKNEDGATLSMPVEFIAGASRTDFTAALPVMSAADTSLTPGRWAISVQVDLGEEQRTVPVKLPSPLPVTKWLHKYHRPYYAKPIASSTEREFFLRIEPVDLAAAAQKGLRRRS